MESIVANRQVISKGIFSVSDSLRIFPAKTWVRPATDGEILAVVSKANTELRIMQRKDNSLATLSTVNYPSGGLGEKIPVIDGTRLFITIHGWLSEYDISDPRNPVFVQNIAPAAQVMKPYGDVYLGTDGGNTFYIYNKDFTVKSSLSAAEFDFQPPDWMEVVNDRCYISDNGSGRKGGIFHVINISDLNNPVRTFSDTLDAVNNYPAGGIALKGSNYAYFPTIDSLLVYDIFTNPDTPSLLLELDYPNNKDLDTWEPVDGIGVWPSNNILVLNDRLFIAVPNHDEVWVYDISDGSNPVHTLTITLPANTGISGITYYDGLLVMNSSTQPTLYIANAEAVRSMSGVIDFGRIGELSVLNIRGREGVIKTLNTTVLNTSSLGTINLTSTNADFGAGLVTIGGSSTDSSAVLNISSTSGGFLPPRMTQAQRDAISNPATGLIIFCTDCTATDASTGVLQTYNGTVWKNHW